MNEPLQPADNARIAEGLRAVREHIVTRLADRAMALARPGTTLQDGVLAPALGRFVDLLAEALGRDDAGAAGRVPRELGEAAVAAGLDGAGAARLVSFARELVLEHAAGSPTTATIALHRAFDDALVQLLEETASTRERILEALHRLTETGLSGGTRALLEQVAPLLAETSRAIDLVAIFLVEDGRLVLRAGLGVDEELARGATVPVDDPGPLGRVLRDRRAWDARVGAEAADVPLESLRRLRARATRISPLGADGEAFGVACVASCTAFEFPEEERLLIHEVCRRAGALLDRRRSLDEGRAREAMRRVGEQSAAILRATACAVYGLNRDGRVAFANPAAARLAGMSPDEMAGEFQHDLVHHTRTDGRPYPWWECPIHRTLHDGEVRRVSDELFFRRDGTGFPVEYVASPIHEGDAIAGVVVAFNDISERRRAVEALQRSEERFRSLVLAMSQIVWIATPDGDVNEDSPSWREYTGRSLTESRGKRWLTALHPDDRERVAQDWRRAVESGSPLETEYRLRRKDGVYRWFLVRGVPVHDAAGRVREWVGACIDVDDQRRQMAEREKLVEELSRERRRLSAILDRIPVGVLIAEAPLGRISLMNREFLHFARGQRELASMADYGKYEGFRLDGTRLRPDEWPLSRALLYGEESKNQEVYFKRADGSVARASMNATPLYDEEGHRDAAVATVLDVTDRREEERRARLLEEATGLLASSLDWAEVIPRALGPIVPAFADFAVVDVLGRDERLERRLAVARDPGLEGKLLSLGREFPLDASKNSDFKDVLWSGSPLLLPTVSPEMLSKMSEDPKLAAMLGELDLRAVAYVPLTARGKVLGVLALGNTDHRRSFGKDDLMFTQELGRRIGMALDNARLYAAAREAVRARDQILSIASHDLKSPLTSLRLQTQMIQRQVQAGKDPATVLESTRSRMQMMDHQLVRLTAMLDELLDVSRIQAGRLELHLETVNLSEVVHEAVARLEHLFEREGCALTLDVEDGIVGIWDRVRLEQVVTNLASNAAKYGRHRPVTIRLWREDDEANFCVEDHGFGIAPADVERIFEPFERVGDHRKIAGTGLGLWIARRVCRTMGGSIDVQSTVGEGSTFYVRLPLAPR